MAERWPPIYDADDLDRSIRLLSGRQDAGKGLYSRAALVEGGPICQGDVVSFKRDLAVVVVDENGEPAEYGEPAPYWLVIGNTCDFHRPVHEVAWSQMVPVAVPSSTGPASYQEMLDLRRYKYSRRFYLPPWNPPDPSVYVADLTLPVTVSKRALTDHARVEARMSREGWILLHAALVRFLCRDDGRFDPGA